MRIAVRAREILHNFKIAANVSAGMDARVYEDSACSQPGLIASP